MKQPDTNARPVQLHVIHDLGGGSAKWLQDFAAADSQRTNLVLRSFSHDRAAGSGIALFAGAGDEPPIQAWTFSSPIVATVLAHAEYRRALDEIVRERRVDVVLVSSLIGHSLEVLDTGLPTLVVNHDYFPYCPAINIHFEGICRECDGRRIEQCHAGNPRFNPFVDFLPPERIAVRSRFMELVRRPNLTMVVPSRSVQDNLVQLNGLFRDVRFATIPHGYGEALVPRPVPEPAAKDRLRVMVFGQLSEAKGLELLEGALAEITRFAEVFLVGAREVGELFRAAPHVHLVSHYDFADLPGHVAAINPHVGVLMSIVPETFSYALSELWMLGVPVAATRVGAFAERIRDRDNGYLFEPSAKAMAAAIEAIDLDRATLAQVRRSVAGWKPSSAAEMVGEYHRIAPVTAARAILPPGQSARPAAVAASPDEVLAAQVMVTAGMWKQVKSVHLQMSLINEARIRSEAASKAAAAHSARDRERLVQGIVGLSGELAERDAGLVDRDARLAHLKNDLEHRNAQLEATAAQLEAVYRSTSWRAASPVRFLGHAVRKLGIGVRVAGWMVREPAAIPRRARRIAEAWRKGGWHETKKAVLGLRHDDPTRKDLWTDYRRKLELEVYPRMAERIAHMSVRPLVAVLMPTFNTREDVLVQAIESVRAQLYPDWELCIADDCSTEPHVRRVLERFAKEDGRINVSFGTENRGVSHASNRALALATADHAVLLDHDDLLEEHALFRVAESIAEDDPDLLYSDEVLVTPDGGTIRRYAYRPAFSLEYLREHPYVVHLVAFRVLLAREVGGFDETLRISQDYDLILRLAERSKAIVHIPDILYRWRIHGGSAGSDRKQQVMDISRAVIQRHLQRSGASGAVEEGERFNLFEARYPLQGGLKVAIIIPTKNHGELLRQCIDSLRATTQGVAYEIVVVDHDSDDPATRAYLLSLAGSARVLRYSGDFNFAAINNFAVAQLGEGFSHYLLCNNDIEAMEAGWLERMLELAQQPSIGIVGAMLFYPDRKHIQHAGVCVGMYGAAEHYAKWVRFPEDPIEPELMRVNREVSAVTAACLLIRADTFAEVRGFDESIAVGFGDVDLCLRVGERGYRIIYSPHARLVHHESYTRGTSRGNDPHPEDSHLFRLKWKALLRIGDPFYNPGYSNEHTHWPVRQPLHVAFEIRRRIARRDLASGRTRMTFSAGQ